MDSTLLDEERRNADLQVEEWEVMEVRVICIIVDSKGQKDEEANGDNTLTFRLFTQIVFLAIFQKASNP